MFPMGEAMGQAFITRVLFTTRLFLRWIRALCKFKLCNVAKRWHLIEGKSFIIAQMWASFFDIALQETKVAVDTGNDFQTCHFQRVTRAMQLE